jgi:hypothetical protein
MLNGCIIFYFNKYSQPERSKIHPAFSISGSTHVRSRNVIFGEYGQKYGNKAFTGTVRVQPFSFPLGASSPMQMSRGPS